MSGVFPDDFPLLTIRVSYDTGRTWEPATTVTPDDAPEPLLSPRWPICECPRCRNSTIKLG